MRRVCGGVDASHECEAHGRNEAENLPFATNRLVKIDDLKVKIEGYDESKNHRQKHLKAKLKAETFLKQSAVVLSRAFPHFPTYIRMADEDEIAELDGQDPRM